jgi:hypothetical protein
MKIVQGYDIIGDIHGHADRLIKLLKMMGYEKRSCYKHPERKAIFLGDFIDRGPAILETLKLVRPMVENGSAYAVMGNHEYNAICFHSLKTVTPKKEVGKQVPTQNHAWLRPRSPKNIMQHSESMIQFARAEENFLDYIGWFKKLPFFLEFKGFRIVHACWDRDLISKLTDRHSNGVVDESFFPMSSKSGNLEKRIADTLLKGKELPLPGVTFKDKDGVERSRIRIKWWQGNYESFNDISFADNPRLPPDMVVPKEDLSGIVWYPEDEKPVFVGHYWLEGDIGPLSRNIVCVDYSVAMGGKLAAYRWDGETRIDASKFIYT